MQVATVIAGPGQVLWISAAVLAAGLAVLWTVGMVIRDSSVIDPAWGPMFVTVALVAALAGEGDAARRYLLLALTALWGLRLGAHLTRRKLREPGEDRRYAAMRARNPGTFPLRSAGIFALQGTLVLLISLPLQVSAGRHPALSPWALAGVLVFALGFLFEAVGDEQLSRFKADPSQAGQVMDRGLWRYTRHPNYFGDACVWWGLWLVAVTAGQTWWTVISPLVMTFLLAKGSGKPMLEKDIAQRRPGYAEYVHSTSGFIPLPPRRAQGG